MASRGGLPPSPRCGFRHGGADAAHREHERVGQRGLGGDSAEVHAQVDDRLGDLGSDAADDALGAHEPGGPDRLEQVLGHEGVDGGHARNVDDGDRRSGVHDPLQQALHHDLGALAVEGPDEGHREDPFPQ